MITSCWVFSWQEKKERELADARANEEELMSMIETLQEQVGLAEGDP